MASSAIALCENVQDDPHVMAVLAIRGYDNPLRTNAAFQASGNDLNSTLRLLNWIRQRRQEDRTNLQRLEVKEQRHILVERLKAEGFRDRSAFLALQRTKWNYDEALTYLRNIGKAKKKGKPPEQTDNRSTHPRKSGAGTTKAATATSASSVKRSKRKSKKPNEVDPSILDSLERETHINRNACKKVYVEQDYRYDVALSKLQQMRCDTQQRLMRSEEKFREREVRHGNTKKLSLLTGYSLEKCEKILAYFGNNYEKAERQFRKYKEKQEGGNKLEVESQETQLLTDFRVRELDMTERRDLEQYFFSRDTLFDIVKVLDQFDNPCCLACPSVAHAAYHLNRDYTLLDIDERFSYLPRYLSYNLYHPSPLTQTFDMVLFDPPYFQVPMLDLVNTVRTVTNQDTSTVLLVAFLRRSELTLLESFSDFRLRPTRYHPGYAHVKPAKRKNYLMYSNWDGLPNNRDKI